MAHAIPQIQICYSPFTSSIKFCFLGSVLVFHMSKTCLKYTYKFTCIFVMSQEKFRNEIHLLHACNIKVFQKPILSFLTRVARYVQSIQKTILQYLKNGMLEDINWLWSCMFRFAQHNYTTELY